MTWSSMISRFGTTSITTGSTSGSPNNALEHATGPMGGGGVNVTLIAAVAANGIIGDEGQMPWHYPKDLAHFKKQTLGKPVIMGRVTYESIVAYNGGPLDDRRTIVLTSNPGSVDTSVNEETEGVMGMDGVTKVHTAGSRSEALALASVEDTSTVFVAGGASVYEQFLPVADRLLLTELNEAFEGDTYFPEWDRDAWCATNREEHDELSFVTYERAETVEKPKS